MPSTTWTPPAAMEPDREYVVAATRFLVSGRWHIPAVFRAIQTFWPQLTGLDDLLSYSLDPDLTRPTFRTLSVWRDGAAVETFVRGEARSQILARTRPWLADSTIMTWTVRGAQFPATWKEVRSRLRAVTSRPILH